MSRFSCAYLQDVPSVRDTYSDTDTCLRSQQVPRPVDRTSHRDTGTRYGEMVRPTGRDYPDLCGVRGCVPCLFQFFIPN